MTAVRIAAPLAAVRTGARWDQDFVFQLADGAPRGDFAGRAPRVVLVPTVVDRRSKDSLVIPSDQVVIWADEGRIAVRVPAGATTGYPLGEFALEVMLVAGDEVESLAVASIRIEQGLGLVADGAASTNPFLVGGGHAGGTVLIRASGFVSATGEGPKGRDGQDGQDGHTPTTEELDQLIDPRVQEAVAAALAALIPTIPDPVLSKLRFAIGAAAGSEICTIDLNSILPGAVVSISPNDGRVVLTGNQQDGFKLTRGATAITAGDLEITVRQRFAPAVNGPLHSKAFTLMAMAADRYMVGLTRIRPNSGNNQVAVAGTERKMSVFVYGAPQYATNGYRFHFSGFASTEGGNSPQETVVPGNDTVIHGVWAIIGAAIVNGAVLGGARYRLTFGGANGVTVASGVNGPWTDEANFLSNVAREANVVVVTEYSTAAGQNQIPNARIQKHRGERIWGAAAGVSLEAMLENLAAPSTPALDVAYGLSTQPQFYGPDLAAAKGWDGRPVILGMADSIGESRQEYSGSADERGNLGVLRRWFDVDDAAYHRTPHYLIGMPGAGSQRELAASALKRWDNLDQLTTWNGGLPPFTRIVDQLGQNDLNATYANMLANHKGAVTRAKARYPGMKVVGFGVLPRTTSTDFYATRQNQTRVSGNEWANPADTWGNGFKWQLEAAREALLDGELSGYIPTRPYWFDAANPGTWAPATITTLAAPAGTDGVATYDQVVLTQRVYVSDIIRWGAAYAGVGIIVDVAPNPGGGWRAILDRSTNTVAAAAGTPAMIMAVNDQVHPLPTEVLRIVGSIPQSEKAKLAA